MRSSFSILLTLFLIACAACAGDPFASAQNAAAENESSVVLPDRLQFADEAIELELGTSIDLTEKILLRHAGKTKDDVQWFVNNANIVAQNPDQSFLGKELGNTTIKATIDNLSDTLMVAVIEPKNPLAQVTFAKAYGVITSSNVLPLLFFWQGENGYRPILSALELQNHLTCDLEFTTTAAHILSIDDNGVMTPQQNGFAQVQVWCGLGSLSLDLLVTAFDTPATTTTFSDTATPTAGSGTEETLLRISTNLTSEYTVLDQRLLLATVTFDSGIVENVTQTFTTPNGNAAQITWTTSNNHIQIENSVATFAEYGTASITAAVGAVSVTENIAIKIAPETPASYYDRFLAEDDFPGYETWGLTECPIADFGDDGQFSIHLCPEILMGLPYGTFHVLSLGSGGSITLALNGFYPVDGAGFDFTIFENPLIDNEDGSFFSERAQVSVSLDGTNYYSFACDAFDANHDYAGCAGVNVVNLEADLLDPTTSGGDSFDLADLGLSYIRYIKITDLQTCVEGDPTYDAESCDGSDEEAFNKKGFDLDALVILNGQIE